MLDWVGSERIEARLIRRMKHAGIQVVRYHALRWYSVARINNRTHRKVLIVDGQVGFTGGVGIADQWSGHAQDPDHWRDLHFQVEGPVVGQMQAAFLDNWIKTTGNVLHGDGYFPDLRAVGNLDMQVFISPPSGGSASMRLMYLAAITAAESSIDIAAAYFIPDRLMTEELVRVSRRGVDSRAGAGQTYGLAVDPNRVTTRMGPAAGKRRGNLPIRADHAAYEDADLRRLHGVGGLDQF